jgi:hypothetical protein
MNRDDFSQNVIEQLARRAAYTCSNPECHRRTLIPEVSSNTDSIYIGIAAHITAAAKNGARYDKTLTNEQRKSIENGIHLCNSCSIKIDKNKGHDYPPPTLRRWKIVHEEWLREQQKQNAEMRREYNKDVTSYHIPIDTFHQDERAAGDIIVPNYNSTVASRFVNVIGQIEKLVTGSSYWIAVSPHGSFDFWWPQVQCNLEKDDFFKAETIVLGRDFQDGGNEDIGRKFDIGLFETTEDSHNMFIEGAKKGNCFERPLKAFLLWKTTVVRVA